MAAGLPWRTSLEISKISCHSWSSASCTGSSEQSMSDCLSSSSSLPPFLLSSLKPAQNNIHSQPPPPPSLVFFYKHKTCPIWAFRSLHPSAALLSTPPLPLCSCRLCQQLCLQTLIDDGCRQLQLCPAFCFYQKTFPFFTSPSLSVLWNNLFFETADVKVKFAQSEAKTFPLNPSISVNTFC